MSAAGLHFAKFWSSPSHRGENDLLQKLLGVRQCPASSVRSGTCVNFPPEPVAAHKPSREKSGHQQYHKIFMNCSKYLDILPSLPGADHMGGVMKLVGKVVDPIKSVLVKSVDN